MAILGFVLGSVGAALVLFLGYILVTTMTNYHDFEGTTAMGFAFVIMPIAAVAGGVAGAVFFAHLAKPRRV
jgi:hypothetical protein